MRNVGSGQPYEFKKVHSISSSLSVTPVLIILTVTQKLSKVTHVV